MIRNLAAMSAIACLICCVSMRDGHAQTADPVFANSFESGVIAFGPALSGVPASAVDVTTDGSLHVTLSKTATAPTFVTVTSTQPSLISINDGGVTVATGQSSAAIQVSSAGTGSAPVTLWATLGNTVGAAVQIIGDGSCVEGDSSGDLPGYTRQCSGQATNYKGITNWDNTYASLFLGPWPGTSNQSGRAFTITVNATQYGAFKIVTGSTQAGISIHPNPTFGDTGLGSVSTEAQGPGAFPGALCYGSDLDISSKTGTAAGCKLQLNSTYYLNISMASTFPPDYGTTCATDACTTGWTLNLYNN
ncbi:MAG TPA: hypothetical protein VGH81_05845 [Rudaea sp.]|jgi:hypothetical protein